MRHHLLVGILAFVLASCAAIPHRDVVSSVTPPLRSEWRHAPVPGPAAEEEVSSWWSRFADPQVQSLIGKALTHNYDLKAAAERVREARAQVTISRSALFPEVDAIASAVRRRTNLPPNLPVGRQTESAAGVGGSWEIDVFGADRLAAAAASAQAEATLEARRDFGVGLAAEVASAYVNLRGLQRQRAVLEKNAIARADTLRLTQVRYRAGLAADLEVAQAETDLRQIEAQLPDVDRQIANEVGELAILTGSTPEEVSEDLLKAAPIPMAPPNLPKSTPGYLLERRPDLRQARREVEAAAASLGVATADRFPKITLAFAASIDQLQFHHLPTATDSLWEIGAGILWPLFDAGRIRANIVAKDAALKERADTFVQTLLRALQDTESAYTDAQGHRQRSAQLQAAVESARRSMDLATSLYTAGEGDFLAVLDAQTKLLDNELALAVSETNASLACVSLYRALGGGWDVIEPPPAGGA